jgi:hypothetical protein
MAQHIPLTKNNVPNLIKILESENFIENLKNSKEYKKKPYKDFAFLKLGKEYLNNDNKEGRAIGIQFANNYIVNSELNKEDLEIGLLEIHFNKDNKVNNVFFVI